MLNLNDVHSYYGQIHALDGISFKVEEGSICCLIGANGAGKSTLLRIMAGEDTKVEGDVRLTKDMRVVHVTQEPQLDPDRKSVV